MLLLKRKIKSIQPRKIFATKKFKMKKIMKVNNNHNYHKNIIKGESNRNIKMQLSQQIQKKKFKAKIKIKSENRKKRKQQKKNNIIMFNR